MLGVALLLQSVDDALIGRVVLVYGRVAGKAEKLADAGDCRAAYRAIRRSVTTGLIVCSLRILGSLPCGFSLSLTGFLGGIRA